MTDEEYNLLSKYGKHFQLITKSSWCPGIPMSDANELKKIYNAYATVKKNINFSCSKCVGDMMRFLSKVYDEEKENRTKEEEVVVENKPKQRKRKNSKPQQD